MNAIGLRRLGFLAGLAAVSVAGSAPVAADEYASASQRKARCFRSDARGLPTRLGTDTLVLHVDSEGGIRFQLFRFDPVIGISRLIEDADYAGQGETSADEHREYAVLDRIRDSGPRPAPTTLEAELALLSGPSNMRGFVVRTPEYWTCR